MSHSTDGTATLNDLREDFLATSTQSMPIAGMIFWALVAVASFRLTPAQTGFMVGFGSGMVFPFGILIDLVRGRKMQRADNSNPVTQMFLQSLALVGALWPLVIIATLMAHAPYLTVLGGAILMGIVWIPYGWAANDPVGLRHAIARAVLSYACFLYIPSPYKVPAISVAVLLCYAYSLIFMRKPPAVAAHAVS